MPFKPPGWGYWMDRNKSYWAQATKVFETISILRVSVMMYSSIFMGLNDLLGNSQLLLIEATWLRRVLLHLAR